MSYQPSELRELALRGESLKGEYIIDSHTHIGGLSVKYHLPDSSTGDMIREMNRLGVNTAITFSFAGVTSDYVYGNDVTAEAVRNFPDRFIGYAVVNPHYHTEMQDELERCKDLGLHGIKLTAEYQKYPPEGPGLFPAYEYAHENSWPIINHNWGSPLFLDRLASTFKNACFIIGHYSLAYADVINAHDNVYQNTCAAINFGDIEKLLEVVPAEKVLFGSDFPDLPLMFSLAPILYARIGDGDKRRILGQTAREIIEKWPGG